MKNFSTRSVRFGLLLAMLFCVARLEFAIRRGNGHQQKCDATIHGKWTHHRISTQWRVHRFHNACAAY